MNISNIQQPLSSSVMFSMMRKPNKNHKPITFYHLKQIAQRPKQKKSGHKSLLDNCCCFTSKIQDEQGSQPARSDMLMRLAQQNFNAYHIPNQSKIGEKQRKTNETFSSTKNQSRLTTQPSSNSMKKSYCAMVIETHLQKFRQKEKKQVMKKQEKHKETKRTFIKVQSKDFEKRAQQIKLQSKTESLGHRLLNLGRISQKQHSDL